MALLPTGESPELNALTIKHRDAALVTIRYKPSVVGPSLESDPTPFVEREQFDFGLFIHNVLNDPKRRRLLRDEAWR